MPTKIFVDGRTIVDTTWLQEVNDFVFGGGQPIDASLTALANLVTAADQFIYFTGADTPATSTITAFARGLLDDVDASAMRTTLGLVIGTNVQAYDAELTAFAGLVGAADRLPYFTGAGSMALSVYTAFARTLLDDVDATAARTTLGAQTDVITTRGDLIRGGSTNTATRYALGSINNRLVSDGTDAVWAGGTRSISSNATVGLTDRDKVILCTTPTVAIAIALPVAASAGAGFRVTFIKTDATTDSVTIDGSTTETINGELTIKLTQQYDTITVLCDGSNWVIESGTTHLLSKILTTSGTSHDFTDIPAGVKQMALGFKGVSTNGTSPPLVQLGDDVEIEATGYVGTVADIDATPAVSNHSTGFELAETWVGTGVVYGTLFLEKIDDADDAWAISGNLGRSDVAMVHAVAGAKTVSARATQVRLTTVNGTDAYDAGAITLRLTF